MQKKTCNPHQRKALVGLTVLALFVALPTAELPSLWSAILAAGQVTGLVLTAVAALKCFFTVHRDFEVSAGPVYLCAKCQIEVSSDAWHCDICDVCVAAYSHHSHWLNCCIGATNTVPYLSCLAGLGLAAVCQTAASIALFAFMLRDRELAIRVGEKYSLRDQGYLFHLFLPFSTLVSASIAIASCSNFSFHLCKLSHRPSRVRRSTIMPAEDKSFTNKQPYESIDATIAGEKQVEKACAGLAPSSNSKYT